MLCTILPLWRINVIIETANTSYVYANGHSFADHIECSIFWGLFYFIILIYLSGVIKYNKTSQSQTLQMDKTTSWRHFYLDCQQTWHFRLLKYETPTFISWGLRQYHLDLNPMNYKSCIEIQLRVCLRKIRNVNAQTLWYGWHGFEQRITNSATDEWCKRLWVCVCSFKRTTFLVFNLTAYFTFIGLHFNLLVLVKITSWCYCVKYITISPFFLLLTFHKLIWLHS